MVLNVKNDIEVTPPATDGISDLAFSPTADLLAASSWDGQVCGLVFPVRSLFR